MTPVKILAIDPGSKEMGLYDGAIRRTIVTSVKAKRPERLAEMMFELTEFFQKHGPYDFVVYEEQFVRGGAATKALFGVVGVIEAVATSCGAGVMSVPQSTTTKWKKGVLSSFGWPVPGQSKELSRVTANYFGLNEEATEHECDAACVYHYIQDRGIING